MMLSRAVKRTCLDSRLLPPTFLLPFTANLSTVSHTTDATNTPTPLTDSAQTPTKPPRTTSTNASSSAPAPAATSAPTTAAPKIPSPQQSPPAAAAAAAALTDSVKELLPLLRAQGPHYITAHLYDRPYLLTQGDTLRVPFLMHDVAPGDILRLTHASALGSRDLTLKAGASAPSTRSPTSATIAVVDPTTTSSSSLASTSRVMPEGGHFVPHLARGKQRYLDPRFFVCRATVLGTEAEPLRVKEKTKRRQRRVKTVKSKHRFTVLKIRELRVRSLEEIESGLDA